MTPKLYTAIFNYMEGAFVTQVRANDAGEVIEAWLEKLRVEPVHESLSGPEPMSVLDYFESCVENKKGFEEQIRDVLRPDIGEPDQLVEMTDRPGVWCTTFLIALLDVEHSFDCTAHYDRALSDPDTFEEPEDIDCPGCSDQAVHLCELYVVETIAQDDQEQDDELAAGRASTRRSRPISQARSERGKCWAHFGTCPEVPGDPDTEGGFAWCRKPRHPSPFEAGGEEHAR
jgi:hypothetical protein